MKLSVQASWGEDLQSQGLSQTGPLIAVILDKLQGFSGPHFPQLNYGGKSPLSLLRPHPPPPPRIPRIRCFRKLFLQSVLEGLRVIPDLGVMLSFTFSWRGYRKPVRASRTSTQVTSSK